MSQPQPVAAGGEVAGDEEAEPVGPPRILCVAVLIWFCFRTPVSSSCALALPAAAAA